MRSPVDPTGKMSKPLEEDLEKITELAKYLKAA